MTAGERIRNLRIEKGMTQDELAKKIGYKSRTSVNKVETCRDLSLKIVENYAKALGTTASYLLGWEEYENDSDSHTWYTKSIDDGKNLDFLSDQEKSLILKFRKLNDNDKEKILSFLDFLLSREEENK